MKKTVQFSTLPIFVELLLDTTVGKLHSDSFLKGHLSSDQLPIIILKNTFLIKILTKVSDEKIIKYETIQSIERYKGCKRFKQKRKKKRPQMFL